MRPMEALPNAYSCDVPSVRIQGDPGTPNGGMRGGFEKDKWSSGWFGPTPSGFRGAKTPYLQVIRSALGRTRTCGLLIRSQLVYVHLVPVEHP
jgi:hypothetical protein